MTSIEVWRATSTLAEAWGASAVVRDFARELPRNSAQASSGLPGYLQELTAAGASVTSRPLRAWSEVEMFRSQLPSSGPPPDEQALARWMSLAQRVESAFRATVGWIRSRLPGYPNLHVPHLVDGTPLTTPEFTWRLAWPRAELRMGLQSLPAPPRAAEALGLGASQARHVNNCARTLAASLAATPEFGRLASARSELDAEARQHLGATNALLRRELAAAAVDGFEPQLAIRRDQYRQERLETAVSSLQGPAHEYARAFEAAARIVELAAGDVFGQLVAYGEPTMRPSGSDLDATVTAEGTRLVAFRATDQEWWNVGDIVWIDDPLVEDALLVTMFSVSFTQLGGLDQQITAEVLENTAAAWQ